MRKGDKMKDTCSNKRLQEIINNQGNASKQISKEIQDAKEEMERENQLADKKLREMLL